MFSRNEPKNSFLEQTKAAREERQNKVAVEAIEKNV
jgi:hypothetical protein